MNVLSAEFAQRVVKVNITFNNPSVISQELHACFLDVIALNYQAQTHSMRFHPVTLVVRITGQV